MLEKKTFSMLKKSAAPVVAGGANRVGGGVSSRSRAPSFNSPLCGCLPLSLNLPLPFPGVG